MTTDHNGLVETTTSPTVGPPVGRSENPCKVVVVHAGARDSYQVALAFLEAGLLDALVTDLFWPNTKGWAAVVHAWLTPKLQELTSRRSVSAMPWEKVLLCALSGFRCLLFEKLSFLPFNLRRWSIRAMDTTLGRTAGQLARRHNALLLSYSYCGYDAVQAYGSSAIIFQAHPHPTTMRSLLREELALHPDCAASLEQEWELALPEGDYEHLVAETRMASHYLCASTFTKRSMIEHGTIPSDITVIPYGVDLSKFCPAALATCNAGDGTLRLLFVGRINQRKGIKYLLEAIRLLGNAKIHLTICGRVVDDLSLFRPFADRVTIRPNVSVAELVAAYRQADLFVFPSIAEGFGQVLLEALASGLPILSTTHTAAPDLIESGKHGFIVEPRRPDLLAERITWALTHPAELAEMKLRARERAEQFTWTRFRSEVVAATIRYQRSRKMDFPDCREVASSRA